MRVYLAAQVLSNTVYTVLSHFESKESAETANLCYFMDRFFDCLNVRSSTEWECKRKPFLKLYTSIDMNDLNGYVMIFFNSLNLG